MKSHPQKMRMWADFLELAANGLDAGLSVEESVRIGLRLDANPTWSQMMSRIEATSGDAGLGFLRPMLELARDAGGKAGYVLRRSARILRLKADWFDRYAGLTLQAKWTAWIVGLSPAVFLSTLGYLSPDLGGVMIQTRAGWMLLMLMVILIASGLWMVHRMARPGP